MFLGHHHHRISLKASTAEHRPAPSCFWVTVIKSHIHILHRYRANVRRLSLAAAGMRERSRLAATRAVRRLATHGARHLRAPLADTSLVEYYMIDLLLVALLFLFFFCCLIVYVTKRIITSLVGRLRTFKTDKKDA